MGSTQARGGDRGATTPTVPTCHEKHPLAVTPVGGCFSMSQAAQPHLGTGSTCDGPIL